MKHLPQLLLVLSASSLAAFPACNDSEVANDSGEGGQGGSGSTEPAYLAMTRVWTDTTTTSYLHVLPSLDASVEVDADEAIELAGPAKLFAHEQSWFAVGSGEDPTITRYSLDDENQLVQGDAISLQPFGVTGLWDSLYFVSDDKAYYPDTQGSQLVVWNPKSMEVTGTIPLPETVREGFVSYYGITALHRGDRLVFGVGWFDWNTNDTILPETGLVVLDTKTDEVVSFEVDDRCAGVTQAIETETGDAYFVNSAMASSAHLLGKLDVAPCALRVRAGEEAFDAEYVADLSELSGESIVGEPAPGGGSIVLLRALAEDAVEVTEETLTWNLTGAPEWRWLAWNVETDSVEELTNVPPATADAFWFRVDGDVLASQTEADYSQTELVLIDPENAVESRVTLPGFVQNVARVR